MNINERVINAKERPELRGALITEYRNFILSVSSKAVGHFVAEGSDAASVAMLAFDEAIQKYDDSKGDFLPFASICIKNRLTDELRSEYRHGNTVPFSALSGKNDNGEETPFEIADTRAEITDTALEINALKQELAGFGISFFDLPDHSPKSGKTKRSCRQVICHIMGSPLLLTYIKEKKMLPVSRILKELKVPEKVLERHRKYILTAVIILSGEYETLAGYLDFIKGGAVK